MAAKLHPKPVAHMQKVKALKSGGTIGIVAPASDVREEDLLKGVSELREMGFRVQYSDSILARHYYFAFEIRTNQAVPENLCRLQ